MKEEWKDIPEYEGYYQVSNLGRVKSLKRTIIMANGKKRIIKEKIRSIKTTRRYKTVGLNREDKGKTFYIHHLVCMAFLNHNPKESKLTIDHINNNSLDNRLENLQIITHRENISKNKKGVNKYTGVYWEESISKYRVRAQINGTRKTLGYFEDEYEAHVFYKEKIKDLENNF